MVKIFMNRKISSYINESLTLIRKKLLGQVKNEFKRANMWRHLWTVNGKILLRQRDSF